MRSWGKSASFPRSHGPPWECSPWRSRAKYVIRGANTGLLALSCIEQTAERSRRRSHGGPWERGLTNHPGAARRRTYRAHSASQPDSALPLGLIQAAIRGLDQGPKTLPTADGQPHPIVAHSLSFSSSETVQESPDIHQPRHRSAILCRRSTGHHHGLNWPSLPAWNRL